MRVLRAVLIVFSCAGLGGCAAPQASLASGSARTAVAVQSDEVLWGAGVGALSTQAIVAAEPLYLRDTCVGAAQVQGSRLRVTLAGAAESPAVRNLLRRSRLHIRIRRESPLTGPGTLAALAPEGWLDVEGRARDGLLVLDLSAESVPKNLELLRRARDAVARRGPP